MLIKYSPKQRILFAIDPLLGALHSRLKQPTVYLNITKRCDDGRPLMETEIEIHQVNELATDIEEKLYRHFGPILFGKHMYSALGFPSSAAFRKALSRNTVPVETFTISNRRGRFVLSKDIALWLAKQRFSQQINEKEMCNEV